MVDIHRMMQVREGFLEKVSSMFNFKEGILFNPTKEMQEVGSSRQWLCENSEVQENKDKINRMRCVSCERVVARGRGDHGFVNRGQIMDGKIIFVKYLGLYSEKHQEPVKCLK